MFPSRYDYVQRKGLTGAVSTPAQLAYEIVSLPKGGCRNLDATAGILDLQYTGACKNAANSQ